MKCRYCGSEWQSKIEVKTCPFCGRSLAEPDSFENIESALAYIMDAHGEQIKRDPNKIVAYLGDLAPHLTNERRLLRMCANAGIIAELYSIADQAERGPAARRAVTVLSGTYFLDVKWAETAVSWLTASMGWTSSANKSVFAVQARPENDQSAQTERIRKRREELKQYAGRIVCSDNHIMALRSNGTVIAYGKKTQPV